MRRTGDSMPDNKIVRIFDDIDLIYSAAAELFIGLYSQEVSKKGRFIVALSGGSTPEGVYKLLASPKYSDKIEWSMVHLFWGDERCVPPGHADSNYKLAHDTLISKISIPQANIHRIKGEMSPEMAAHVYEEDIRRLFRNQPVVFDLIFLGLGPDGHTLSLFPSTQALTVTNKLVVGNFVEKLGAWRITMTLAAVNNAKNAVFLVTGAGKAAVFSAIINETGIYPASLVKLTNGSVTWLVDKNAAGRR